MVPGAVGVFIRVASPSPSSHPRGITTNPSEKIFFTEQTGVWIGQIV
jgi:hypothetical protein